MPGVRSVCRPSSISHFFFNAPATTEIYTLSLHDALPICRPSAPSGPAGPFPSGRARPDGKGDRKSTRLNSSHMSTSYAVFCLKKKNSAPAPSAPRTRAVRPGEPCSRRILCVRKPGPEIRVEKQLEGPRSRGPIRVFFFNDTATTEIYTLSLHDALPI